MDCRVPNRPPYLPKCFPYVVAQTVQPKEGAHQCHVQNNIGHHETNVTAEFGENAHQICCLAHDQAHGDCGYNVAHQVTITRIWGLDGNYATIQEPTVAWAEQSI